ncbi:MAG: hypothetical protein AAGJ46_05305 [Planctomycetota bacterium]
MTQPTRVSPLFSLLTALCVASPVSAGLVYQAEFDTDGDFEGWVDFQNRLGSSTVSGGVWSGSGGTSGDPQLRTTGGAVEVDLSAFPAVELQIRAKNNTGEQMIGGVSYVSFVGPAANNTPGLPTVNFNFTPAAADTFEVFKVDVKSIIAGLAGTDNVLRSIRLDVINTPVTGDTFEIDWVRVVAIPEPSLMLPLSAAATCVATARRRRHV